MRTTFVHSVRSYGRKYECGKRFRARCECYWNFPISSEEREPSSDCHCQKYTFTYNCGLLSGHAIQEVTHSHVWAGEGARGVNGLPISLELQRGRLKMDHGDRFMTLQTHITEFIIYTRRKHAHTHTHLYTLIRMWKLQCEKCDYFSIESTT